MSDSPMNRLVFLTLVPFFDRHLFILRFAYFARYVIKKKIYQRHDGVTSSYVKRCSQRYVPSIDKIMPLKVIQNIC